MVITVTDQLNTDVSYLGASKSRKQRRDAKSRGGLSMDAVRSAVSWDASTRIGGMLDAHSKPDEGGLFSSWFGSAAVPSEEEQPQPPAEQPASSFWSGFWESIL